MYLSKSIIRGSEELLEWEFDGELASGAIYFTAKRDSSLTGDRLLDVVCSRVFDGLTNVTIVSAFIEPADSESIVYGSLVYDVTLSKEVGEGPVSLRDVVLARGNLTVRFDVRTPFDGTDVDPELYVPVKRSEFEDGQFIQAVEADGVTEFRGVFMDPGLFEYDVNGDLMPRE